LKQGIRELEVETTKLTTEREILQRAARYFAALREYGVTPA
jgi:transposase